tara:strand:+ start:2349 stop:4565 length:2217 start_codon:yes stop_codon:yes gene_type:complete
MPIFNGDLEFFDGSGAISVTNGDLTIRTDDPSRSIIIASGAALRSDRDIASDLGTANLRWHAAHVGNLFCTSGEIAGLTMTDTANTFGVDVVFNGVNVQFINSATTTFDDFSDISIAGDVFIGGTTSFDTRSDLKPWIDASTSLGNAEVRWSTIHAASGIFNIIAPPESGTHIQVNGDLRPSEDASYSLGTSDVRWDNIFSRSGVIGFNTFDINGVNFQDQVEFEGDVSFNGISTQFVNSATLTFDDSSNITIGGDVFIGGTTSFDTRSDLRPFIDASTSLGNAEVRWSTIHAVSGILNILAPPESGTHIQVNSSLHPSEDALYSLGAGADADTGSLVRWADVYAASGHFNAIYPQVSGTGIGGNPGVWIELGGSLIPSLDNADLFWFGHGKNNRHAGVDVASGIFDDIEATTADLTTIDTSTVNIAANGDFINGGAFDWDLGGAQTLVGNGDWVFDTDATLSATTGTITTATIPTLGSTTITAATINSTSAMNCFGTFGTLGLATFNGGVFFGNAAAPSVNSVTSFGLEGFKWGNIYSVSGIFDAIRPATSGGTMIVHGHLDPANDAVFDLGTIAHRWGAIHAVSGVFDNLQVNEGVAEYYLGINTGNFQGTLTTVPYDVTVIEDTNYYSRTGGVVTILIAGLYSVSYGTNINQITGNGRSTCSGQMTLNSTERIRQSNSYVYSRETNQGEGTLNKTFLVQLDVNDTLEMQCSRTTNGGVGFYEHLEGSNLSLRFIR